MNALSKAVAMGLLAALAAFPAHAQPLTWSGLDNTISINFPAGWRRLDEMMRERIPGSVASDVLIEMDKGDAIMGAPGVNCRMKVQRLPVPTGETADTMNRKIRENPVVERLPMARNMTDRRINTVGDVLIIENERLVGDQDDMMIWQPTYAYDKAILMPNITCRPNVPRTGITADQAKDVRAMFAAIKITLK